MILALDFMAFSQRREQIVKQRGTSGKEAIERRRRIPSSGEKICQAQQTAKKLTVTSKCCLAFMIAVRYQCVDAW